MAKLAKGAGAPIIAEKPTPVEFPFVGSAVLQKRLDIRKTQRQALMTALPSPLYWWQFPGENGRKVFWNWTLVQDYLLRGNTTDPGHQALVEVYLSTLPHTA